MINKTPFPDECRKASLFSFIALLKNRRSLLLERKTLSGLILHSPQKYNILISMIRSSFRPVALATACLWLAHLVRGEQAQVCEDATELELGVPVQGTTVDGIMDFPFDFCMGRGDALFVSPPKWLSYQSVGITRTVEISTCRPGTDFDTQLTVFRGSCSSLSCVATNNNVDDSFLETCSTLIFEAQADVRYSIMVHGSFDAVGSYDLILNTSTGLPGSVGSDVDPPLPPSDETPSTGFDGFDNSPFDTDAPTVSPFSGEEVSIQITSPPSQPTAPTSSTTTTTTPVTTTTAATTTTTTTTAATTTAATTTTTATTTASTAAASSSSTTTTEDTGIEDFSNFNEDEAIELDVLTDPPTSGSSSNGKSSQQQNGASNGNSQKSGKAGRAIGIAYALCVSVLLGFYVWGRGKDRTREDHMNMIGEAEHFV